MCIIINSYSQLSSYAILLASTNQYVEVRFEPINRIICTFRDQQNNQNKSCNLVYGPCLQNRNFNMTIQGTRVSPSSPSIVMIDLPPQLVASGYCYVINANNGTFTTLIEGTFSKCVDITHL